MRLVDIVRYIREGTLKRKALYFRYGGVIMKLQMPILGLYDTYLPVVVMGVLIAMSTVLFE